MPPLPIIPSWDEFHPLVIHFPIALLLASPVFLVLGLAIRSLRQDMFLSALLLMVMGTIAAWISVASGEAAGKLVERTPEISVVLERHAELAELARNVFTALVCLYAAIVWATRRLLQAGAGLTFALHGAFLLLYVAGMLLLVNAAHNGGRLVYQLGIGRLGA